MATKQWIGIEEAATKYQVSTRRIITWCERQEIIYSEVGEISGSVFPKKNTNAGWMRR